MPVSFNTPLGIFLFGCAGAIAPELIRLYKLRGRTREIRFRPSYFVLILPFVVLGGIVAVVLDTSPIWSAFAAGIAVEYTVSAVASSSALPQRQGLTDGEVRRIADRIADRLADQWSTTMNELQQEERAQAPRSAREDQTLKESRTEYQIEPRTAPPEGVDESSLASRLDKITMELRQLSKQVAEIQQELSLMLEQRHATPSSSSVDEPREITFREFLGAIWW